MKNFDRTELIRMGIASVGKPAVLFARGNDEDILQKAIEEIKKEYNSQEQVNTIVTAIILEQAVFFDTFAEAVKLYDIFCGDTFYASDIYAEIFDEHGQSQDCNT